MRKFVHYSLIAVASLLLSAPAAFSAGDAPKAPQQEWSWEGVFGTFDRAAAQRGYQVYREVCASCHAMKYVSFRHLKDIGFSEAELKTIAAEYTYKDGPDADGEMFERPGKLFDYMPNPYENDNQARATNNGALPPDLSLVIKARHDGANYTHALLTGYTDAPAGETGSGYYNKYFPGHWIAMAAPLAEGQVDYSDGTKATVDQMSRDVVTFLTWASEPTMEERKAIGIKVMGYLLIFCFLLWLTKRKVWASAK